MNIDPKQIAKMITEDPDEVNPLDNVEDEFEDGLGFCDGCFRDIDYNFLDECENCGKWWCEICMGGRSGFVWSRAEAPLKNYMSSCPNCNRTHRHKAGLYTI